MPNTKLTEDTHRRVVLATKTGAPRSDVAAYAGVSEFTLEEWSRRGHAYDEHLNAGGEIIEGEDAYRLFALDLAQAKADVRVSAAGTLRKAWGLGEWRAALAFLERSDPANWSRVQRTELTGADGGAIRVADVTDVERRLVSSIREVAAASKELPAAETYVNEPYIDIDADDTEDAHLVD